MGSSNMGMNNYICNMKTTMNIIIHKYKPYIKGKSYITFAFFTYIKYDVLTMLDNIAMDNRLKPKTHEQTTRSSARTSKKNIRAKI